MPRHLILTKQAIALRKRLARQKLRIQIAIDYLDGTPLKRIAFQRKITVDAVMQIARKFGCPGRNKNKKKPPDPRQQARLMRVRGHWHAVRFNAASAIAIKNAPPVVPAAQVGREELTSAVLT